MLVCDNYYLFVDGKKIKWTFRSNMKFSGKKTLISHWKSIDIWCKYDDLKIDDGDPIEYFNIDRVN